VAGSCGYGNKFSDSIKSGDFIDQLSDYQFLIKSLLHGVIM
jgi:hypothetical protein